MPDAHTNIYLLCMNFAIFEEKYHTQDQIQTLFDKERNTCMFFFLQEKLRPTSCMALSFSSNCFLLLRSCLESYHRMSFWALRNIVVSFQTQLFYHRLLYEVLRSMTIWISYQYSRRVEQCEGCERILVLVGF